jgi:hypothetical protein
MELRLGHWFSQVIKFVSHSVNYTQLVGSVVLTAVVTKIPIFWAIKHTGFIARLIFDPEVQMIRSSETLVHVRTTQRCIQEDCAIYRT